MSLPRVLGLIGYLLAVVPIAAVLSAAGKKRQGRHLARQYICVTEGHDWGATYSFGHYTVCHRCGTLREPAVEPSE